MKAREGFIKCLASKLWQCLFKPSRFHSQGKVIAMTKKDYEIIAELLSDAESRYQDAEFIHARLAVRGLAMRFADKLATSYPRFNRDRFLQASCPLYFLQRKRGN
jgi:hypothetical protein